VSLILIPVLIVLIAAVYFLVAKAKSRVADRDVKWPFYARKPLSAPEQVLYFRLCRALPVHIVLAQVGLSCFLGVKRGSNFQSWYNRINRMSADFVVCAKDSRILAVIELDDSSHTKKTRKMADAKKDKALASAGIRIIRWNVKAIPSEADITSEFIPKSAVAPRGAQSFRHEDNALLPLRGLRSAVANAAALPLRRGVAGARKDFAAARLSVFMTPGSRAAVLRAVQLRNPGSLATETLSPTRKKRHFA